MRQYFFKSWDEGYTSLCKYLAIDEENVWLNRICLPSGQLLWGWIDDQRRNPMSPVYATSTVCLTARTDMASFVDSMAAPLSVINALIVALGLRRKDELSEHFRLMEGIWDEYRVYVGKDRV